MTNNKRITEEKLIELIEGRMPFPATVNLDSHLFDELGFDSMLLLDLIVAIEQECDGQFSDGDLNMDALSTPRKLIELIGRQSGQNDPNDAKADA